MHYVNSNAEKGRTFYADVPGRNDPGLYYDQHPLPSYLEIDNTVYRPLQFTEWTNMDGYWDVRARASYGFPVNFIKSNLNLRGGVSYSRIPSLVDGERNNTGNLGYEAGVVLGSNISENVDFTLSWDGTYNEAVNSLAATGGKNRYFNHQAAASFKFIFGRGFSLSGSASYIQYLGFTKDTTTAICSATCSWARRSFATSWGKSTSA